MVACAPLGLGTILFAAQEPSQGHPGLAQAPGPQTTGIKYRICPSPGGIHCSHVFMLWQTLVFWK